MKDEKNLYAKPKLKEIIQQLYFFKVNHSEKKSAVKILLKIQKSGMH